MGLFSKKKEPTNDASHNEVDKEEKKDKKATETSDSAKSDNHVKEKKDKIKKSSKVLTQDTDGSLAYEFIVRPWITEKTHELMSTDKYVFKVRPNVNKIQVKRAIEKLYGVEVEKINMVKIPQKKRRFGRIIGKKSAVKKAIATLKKGNKIEFFE